MAPFRRCSVLLFLGLVAACDASSGGSGQTTSQPSASPSAAQSGDRSTAASAVPSGSAAIALGHAGRWKATYRAAKAEVAVPKDAPSRTWADDDGTAATGEGSVELSIAPDGAVKGRAKGPLGEQHIRGVFDGKTLRAGLTPVDPEAELAMSGVLVGSPQGKEIAAQLRVSSRDATIVRAATVQLARR